MKTTVIFRKFKNGEILALFPDIKEGNGMCSSYMHTGQHSSADYGHCISITKPASPIEFLSLEVELTNHCGYILNIKKKHYRHRRI